MLVNVMGAFGSGKSTLVNILGEDLDAKKYLENPNFLRVSFPPE